VDHPLAAAFRALLGDADRMPRWEDVLPVHWGGCDESDTLTVRLGGALAACDLGAALAPAFGPAWTADGAPRGGWTRLLEAPGRRVLLGPGAARLTVRGNVRRRPADDDGAQDALVALFAGPFAAAVRAVETERWTDSPFEEPPAHVQTGADARSLLQRLAGSTVCLELVADFFVGIPNPYVGVADESETEPFLQARADRGPSTRWLPPGAWRIYALARATAFPEYAVMPSERAHAIVWRSPVVALDARAPGHYRLRAGVPEARRALDDDERRWFATRGEEGCLGPREVLELALEEVRPLRPRETGRARGRRRRAG
jgi:hypothetical protein